MYRRPYDPAVLSENMIFEAYVLSERLQHTLRVAHACQGVALTYVL